jgi:Domain of unknown function (DUF4157)
MRKLAGLAVISILTFFGGHPVSACDPNEECSRCLASAFGNCITHGNDPICEARKAACRVAPPVVNTPGSPFAPGGLLGHGGPMGLSAPQIQNCIANLSSCPGQIIAQIGYQTVKPIVDGYIGFLNNQVGSNARTLPDEFISPIQQFYSVNLRNVRYATNINTIHGSNITIGNMIYFVNDIDFNDSADAQLAYHELEHVVQYARRGGIEPFLAEYILKAGGSILRGGNSIDIHDNIDLERAAISKAAQVANAVGTAPGPYSSQPSYNPQPSYTTHANPTAFPGPNACRTPFGSCLIPPGPVGVSCFCGTPGGRVNGISSQN